MVRSTVRWLLAAAVGVVAIAGSGRIGAPGVDAPGIGDLLLGQALAADVPAAKDKDGARKDGESKAVEKTDGNKVVLPKVLDRPPLTPPKSDERTASVPAKKDERTASAPAKKDEPAEPASKKTDRTIEKPIERSAEKTADRTAGKSAGKAADRPAEKVADKAAEKIADKAVAAPSKKPDAAAKELEAARENAALNELARKLAERMAALKTGKDTKPASETVKVQVKSAAPAAAAYAQETRRRTAALQGMTLATHAAPAPSHTPVITHSMAGQAPAPSVAAARGAPSRPLTAAPGTAFSDPPPGSPHHQHWSYDGDSGPDAWSRLRPEYASCGNGARQSPIDIREGIRVDLEPIRIDYRATAFKVVDNGHTVQANFSRGNSIQIMGRRYELVQFHFHHPAEERIDGKSFDMVAHLVHRDPEGRLAVIAVLMQAGDQSHPVLRSVWGNIPLEKNEEVPGAKPLDPAQLLPEDRSYYTFMGSLTTPPCSEGVLWMVMRTPITISREQIATFARFYPMNARPIQQANGRVIKESP